MRLYSSVGFKSLPLKSTVSLACRIKKNINGRSTCNVTRGGGIHLPLMSIATKHNKMYSH